MSTPTTVITGDLARRFPQNPLLAPKDIIPSIEGMTVECVLNPGAFTYNGKTRLLIRIAERPEQKDGIISLPVINERDQIEILEFRKDDPKLDASDPRVINHDGLDYLTTLSHLQLFSSTDGVTFTRDKETPLLTGQGSLERFGIEDPRVAKLGETYYITYSAASADGVGVGMRSTKDWKTTTRHGMIIPPHNKDCALFEETIGGTYYAFHRPSSVQLGGNYIWLSESPDLLHWGNHRCIATTRPGKWDSSRIGAGASPIRTEKGWLEIYHGADDKSRYCLGALLLDLNEPWKVLARSEKPIMEPLADYEKEGFFGNVVFTNGHVVDGDTITLYYGASDSYVCGAHLSIREILASLGK